MRTVDLVGLTQALVDIDSTTGAEAMLCRWLSGYLRELGFDVVEQPVDGARFNIVATVGPPEVVLSTHVDCVPPYFPCRLDGDRIYGRGACDAKGILAAQIAAVEQLRRQGESRVGLLFVVGEERGSDGARAANAATIGSRFLVDGEPTDGRLASATRGMLRVRLHAAGRAAHSSSPELGESAIDRLVDAIVQLRGIPLPRDPSMGPTTYTIGLISGGVAPNVVSPSAVAEVMFRTVSDAGHVRRAIGALEAHVRIEPVHEVPLARMMTLPGFESAVFPFTTDVPFLANWGQPLLYGPGSIHAAHTDDESITVAELSAAVDGYVRIAAHLLSRARAADVSEPR